MGTEESKSDLNPNRWPSDMAFGQWMALPVSGSRPAARYKHAATVANEKLYIVGGSRNGRHLSDIQVFDLRTLVWSAFKLHLDPNSDNLEDSRSRATLPAVSGHSLVKWENKLLVVAGHSKESSDYSQHVSVWSIDLQTCKCSLAKTSGEVPICRGGQSVSLSGSQLIMFGGEDTSRKLLNDIHILDLKAMAWFCVDSLKTTPPAPRFDHTAALHAERYLLIFGGCSHSTCFNDLHVLDLQTMEWSQPQIQGDLVTPRAGHASIVVEENWYTVGGGDNKSGAPETLVLNMSKLVWSVLTRVNERDPLASEGLSLCSALVSGENYLIAFGGYNGKYTNEVFVLRLKPRDSARPKIFQSPAAAAAAASVTAAYALATKPENKPNFMSTEDSNFQQMQMKSPPQDITAEINSIMEEKKKLESSLAEVKTENSRLNGDLEEMNTNLSELSKELHSVQGQLTAERSRCSKLETQIEELQKMLESLQSIENEVRMLQNQKFAFERDMELASAQKQNSGGIWQWIAGEPRNP